MNQNKRLEAKISKKINQTYNNDEPTRSSPIAYQNFPPRSKFANRKNNPNIGRSHNQRPNQPFDWKRWKSIFQQS